MSNLDSNSAHLIINGDSLFNEAQIAAAAFLARYCGRTLDAYRHDLRTLFQWASDVGLDILQAKRPHIELYRSAMDTDATNATWRRAIIHLLQRLNPMRRRRSNPHVIKRKMPKWHVKCSWHADWIQPTGRPSATIRSP